jgi:hypothetical protein
MLGRSALTGPHALPCDVQRKIGNEIEEKDANFVDGHARVMDPIELLNRYAKPSTVKPAHPVVGKPEEQEPQKQHPIVDGCAPQENLTRYLDLHLPSPTCRQV